MSVWNLLGELALFGMIRRLFSSPCHTPVPSVITNPRSVNTPYGSGRNYADKLYEKIDALETELDDLDIMSDRYDDIQDEIDSLQDRIDEIEDAEDAFFSDTSFRVYDDNLEGNYMFEDDF